MFAGLLVYNLLMDKAAIVLISLFVGANLFAFFLMLLDKTKARIVGAERISEGMLFFMAASFASIGVYAGMFAFRHKTRKWYFLVGMPLLFLENCATMYLVYSLLVNKI